MNEEIIPEQPEARELYPEEIAYRERLRSEAYNQRMQMAGIPEEYFKYSITPKEGKKIYDCTDFHGAIIPSKVQAYKACANYIMNLQKHREAGTGIYFFGPPNQKLGMSLLGTFIMRAALEAGHKGIFVPFSTFCEDMDCSYHFEDKLKYYSTDFLMIDSISQKSCKSAKVCDGIADVILSRRAEKKPTIFSSYIPPDVLASLYSESMMSYLDEYVSKIEIINTPGKMSVMYNIDHFTDFVRKQRRDNQKSHYSSHELEDLLKRFQNQYKYMYQD